MVDVGTVVTDTTLALRCLKKKEGVMKVEWSEEDILAGRRFKSASCNEVWMIGYQPLPEGPSANRHTIISLSDGMINAKLTTKQDVVEFLNRNADLPLELLDGSWRKSKG